MFLKIEEIENKEIWENFFLKDVNNKTFLQSFSWGEFNRELKNKVWRLGVFKGDQLIAVCLVIKITAKRGSFLLIQHGPNIATGQKQEYKQEILKTLINKLKSIAKKERCSFIRISPLLERNEENKTMFKELGFINSAMHANAYESTWKLDLSLKEEDILKNMRKTTRYLIRQAQKNSEIEVYKSENPKDIDFYNKLNRETAHHKKFVPFSFDFIKNEFRVLSENKEALLFFAKYQNEIIAGALVIFWSGIAFYHQAAFSPKHHKLPVSYFLQWEIIKEAKIRKCFFYDFWGYIEPESNRNHPWSGPSLFKRGFGGRPYYYIKTQDLPLSFRYWPVFLFEKIRKINRNL